MGRRGGWRPRKWVIPGQVPVWVSSGRWGPRRARVTECFGVLRAEELYTALLKDNADAVASGAQGTAIYTLGDREVTASWEIRQNAVWRRGRVFFRCPRCERRATRLYVPLKRLEAHCRRCWGLSYESQSWSYKATSFLGHLFGPVAYVTTSCRREERQRAARTRYDARRAFL